MENQVIDQVHTEQAAPIPQPAEMKNEVGFWEFIGLIALFAIPVVGFIACIVFMFSPKRKSMKNFARATMTWMVVRIVATALIVSLLVTVIGNLLLPLINDGFGTEFEKIQDVFGIVADVQSGDYSGVVAQMRPQIEGIIGEEYAPLLDELESGEYNEMINQIKDQEYEAILNDIKDNKYPQLEEVLGEENLKTFSDELEKAANGEPSEFFDTVKGYIPSF